MSLTQNWLGSDLMPLALWLFLTKHINLFVFHHQVRQNHSVICSVYFHSSMFEFSGEPDRNVIMWMDHRAGKQCKVINATNHRVLRNVGGSMSVEMQTPKLLWIKDVRRRVPVSSVSTVHHYNFMS